MVCRSPVLAGLRAWDATGRDRRRGAHLVTYEYPDEVNALFREHLANRSNTSSRM